MRLMGSSNLVQVYTASEKGSADLVRAYLKENGIKSLIKVDSGPGEAIFGNFGAHSPLSGWEVYVLESEEKKAKELLSKFEEEKE